MKALVLDLDGTLLNTLADIGNACNIVLERHGYAGHALSAYRQMVGSGFPTLLRRAAPQGLEQAALDMLVQEAREYYAGHMMEETRPYEGMTETLDLLAQRGIALAVLSNKPDNLSTVLISHYFRDIPFRHVQGAREGIALKPDPSSLLALLADMRADTANSYYAGDSDIDVQTGHNARIKSIGAAWGFRGETELEDAGADLIIHEPRQLADILQN